MSAAAAAIVLPDGTRAAGSRPPPIHPAGQLQRRRLQDHLLDILGDLAQQRGADQRPRRLAPSARSAARVSQLHKLGDLDHDLFSCAE